MITILSSFMLDSIRHLRLGYLFTHLEIQEIQEFYNEIDSENVYLFRTGENILNILKI